MITTKEKKMSDIETEYFKRMAEVREAEKALLKANDNYFRGEGFFLQIVKATENVKIAQERYQDIFNAWVHEKLYNASIHRVERKEKIYE